MSRLSILDPAHATGAASDLLASVQKSMKVVPNMMRVMASSPSALGGYLGFSGALASGALSKTLRERLALWMAQENECTYCLSAHSAIGASVGLSAEEISASRRGAASDPKEAAALCFAKAVLSHRGAVSDADLDAVRKAGFGDGEITEIVAHVGLNSFTNTFNRLARPDVDFPLVSP